MKQANNNLKAALQQEGQPPRRETPEPVESAPVEQAHRRPSRQGKKLISGHFNKDVHYQLKLLSLETDSTIQQLLADSLNLLLRNMIKNRSLDISVP